MSQVITLLFVLKTESDLVCLILRASRCRELTDAGVALELIEIMDWFVLVVEFATCCDFENYPVGLVGGR